MEVSYAEKNLASDFYGDEFTIVSSSGTLTCSGLPTNIEADFAGDTYDLVVDCNSGNSLVLSSPGLLPVEFLFLLFEARINNERQISLEWATVSKTNSKFFKIQRSDNGIDWKVIGERIATGFSNVQVYYSFFDVAPNPGKNYYRLQQLDQDGTFYFPIKLYAGLLSTS